MALVLVMSASIVFGQSSKLSRDLQSLPSGNAANVIVQYLRSLAPQTRVRPRWWGRRTAEIRPFKGNGYRMSPAAAAKLVSLNANVKYISLDRPLRGAMNFAVSAVNADLALNLGYDGTGVGVAVIDSGVNAVTDLNGRVAYSQNFDPSQRLPASAVTGLT
jgi:serine protease AprX